MAKSVRSFKEASYQERIERLYTCIVPERKAIFLIEMGPHFVATADIAGKVIASLGLPLEAEKGMQVAIKMNCTQSLEPIAMAAEGKVYKKGVGTVKAWRRTSDGENFGKYASALGLEFSANYLHQKGTLSDLIGRVSSRGTQGTFNSHRLIKYLVEEVGLNNKCRKIDLANDLELYPSAVGVHIRKLEKHGYIKYRSVNTEESGWGQKYYFVGKKYPTKTKARMICKFLDRNPGATWDKINKSFELDIGTLNRLTKKGFIESKGKFKGTNIMSSVIATTKMKTIYKNLILPVDEIASDANTDTSYFFSAFERLQDECHKSEVYKKAYENWKMGNRYGLANKGYAERRRNILVNLLQEKPYRQIELFKKLNSMGIDVMVVHIIDEDIKKLKAGGYDLRTKKDGRAVYYYITT